VFKNFAVQAAPRLRAPESLFAFALLLSALLCAPALARGAKVSKESIEYGGRARAYYLYVPSKLDTSRRAPLVFVLHGSGGEGRALVEKWRGLADEKGLIVVGPDSLDRMRWSIPEDGPDLLRDIAGAVGAKHPVDVKRVYLFGHSAGANSALPLGLFESEYFAAVAAHAGGMRPERYGLADYARRKIPLAFIVGTDDALALSVARATHEEMARRGFAPLMHEIPGHDHNYQARASKINRQVWDFFERHALPEEPRYVRYNWGPAAASQAATSGAVVNETPAAVALAAESPKTPPRLRGEDDERDDERAASAGSKSKAKSVGESKASRAEAGEDEDEVVRVSTSLVAVPVTVADDDGRYVTDLRREEFKVFEDGVEQQVAFFEPVEKAFTVALVIDVSDSTSLRLKDIQAAALAFLEQLRPEDRVLLVTFDRRVQVLAEATGDRARLAEAVANIRPGVGTSLFNALDMVIKQRLAAVRGRKAVVLFSDGVDTTSAGATYASNMANVEEFGGAVYTVRFESADAAGRNRALVRQAGAGGTGASPTLMSRRVPYEMGSTYLYEVADRTGARALSAPNAESLSKAFVKIAEELRRQYTVSYYPARATAPGRRRKIKVRVTREKVSVRSRKTYVSAAGADN
jgi:VWFA-related protein